MSEKILLIGKSTYAPSDRFRLIQFIEHYKKYNYTVDYHCPKPDKFYKPKIRLKIIFWIEFFLLKYLRIFLMNLRFYFIDINQYTAILINKLIIPDPDLRYFEKKILKHKNLIFDFDDAIFLNKTTKAKFDYFVIHSTKVFAGNQLLAEYATKLNINTYIIPTVIDTDYYSGIRNPKLKDDPITFGWIGSYDAMRFALPVIKNAAELVFSSFHFKLLIICDKEPTKEEVSIPYEFIKWHANTEIESMKKIDVGLMPLVDNEFQRGKCGAKLIQYMGIGIPSICTPIGVNTEIIKNKKTGFYASSESEWISIMTDIIKNKFDLKTMGKNAYEDVKKRYSVDSVMPKIITIINKT